jgi:hypothetical protein
MENTDNIRLLNNKGSMNFIQKRYTQTQNSMKRKKREQQSINEKNIKMTLNTEKKGKNIVD